MLGGSSELKANERESTWCTDNDREAATSAHIGRSVLRPLEGEDVEEEEEEVVVQEDYYIMKNIM